MKQEENNLKKENKKTKQTLMNILNLIKSLKTCQGKKKNKNNKLKCCSRISKERRKWESLPIRILEYAPLIM